MAERRTARSRRVDDEVDDRSDEPRGDESDESDGEAGERRRSRGNSRNRGAARAAQLGLRQIGELTGKRPEGVTGVEPGEDGWIVGVEVVEDRRVPSSADILAIYEAELDTNGDLLSYRRVRRYARGRGDDGGDS
jgi:Gas vesicle synthesis protein GvpO